MAKSKTFHSTHEGPIVVAVPGQAPVSFEPGGSLETDDPNVINALTANPDVASGGKKEGKK
jgi:hypothetical protein